MSLATTFNARKTAIDTKRAVSFKLNPVLARVDLLAIDPGDVALLKREFATCFEVLEEEILAISDIYSFDGFNVDMIYRHILVVYKKYGLSGEDLRADLVEMLVIHQLKGNVNSKNFGSLRAEGKQRIFDLWERWSIQESPKVDRALAFTIPRLAAAFPYPLATISSIIPNTRSGFCDSQTLPACMQNGSFAAIIPKNVKISKLFIDACVSYGTDASIILTGRSSDVFDEDGKKKEWKAQEKHVLAAYSQSPVADQERKHHFVRLDLGKEDIYTTLTKCVAYSGNTNYCTKDEYLKCFSDFDPDFQAIESVIDKYSTKSARARPSIQSGVTTSGITPSLTQPAATAAPAAATSTPTAAPAATTSTPAAGPSSSVSVASRSLSRPSGPTY
jgi:hypothetical protein